MTQIDPYRQTLRTLEDWDAFLMAESGLPGARGNIELGQAAADEGTEAQFRHWLTYDADKAPTNTQEEFLAFCGVVGFGRLLAQGHPTALAHPRRGRHRLAAFGRPRHGQADRGDGKLGTRHAAGKARCGCRAV